MGQFGRVDMTIEFESEVDAIKVSEEIIQGDKLKEFVAESTEGEFDFDIDDVSGADEFAYIVVTSGRGQHAVWMAEMIQKFLIEIYRDVVVTISAEMNTPENIIHWEKDDE